MFDIEREMSSNIFVIKNNILSKQGNNRVKIVKGNTIILIIGTKIIFTKILTIFIS